MLLYYSLLLPILLTLPETLPLLHHRACIFKLRHYLFLNAFTHQTAVYWITNEWKEAVHSRNLHSTYWLPSSSHSPAWVEILFVVYIAIMPTFFLPLYVRLWKLTPFQASAENTDRSSQAWWLQPLGEWPAQHPRLKPMGSWPFPGAGRLSELALSKRKGEFILILRRDASSLPTGPKQGSILNSCCWAAILRPCDGSQPEDKTHRNGPTKRFKKMAAVVGPELEPGNNCTSGLDKLSKEVSIFKPIEQPFILLIDENHY